MIESLIECQTVRRATPLVPEIALHLARDATGIFEAIDAVSRAGEKLPPYWAFAWPGGQATARWLLDHRREVRGKRVVDIGAGSGIAAIAAMLAGARHVLAADIDSIACVAIAMNARLAGVTVQTTTADVLGDLPEADLVLLGDLVYEPEMETRTTALLETAALRGVDVLVADRTSARRLRIGNLKRGKSAPPIVFEPVADYDAALDPPLPAHPFERARLWRLQTAPRPTSPQ